MQTNECNYCGTTLDYSVYQCTNCGGQVKQLSSIKPQQIKKIIFFTLLAGLVIAPFIYKKHLNNIATTVLATLQNTPEQTSSISTTLAKSAETTKKLFEKKNKLIQVISMTMPIKVVVVEFYMTQARFPKSLDELGFNENSFDTGELIQKIQLSATGKIEIDLNSDVFGQRKYISLTPREIMGGMNIQWSCSSNLERGVVPFQCESI